MKMPIMPNEPNDESRIQPSKVGLAVAGAARAIGTNGW